jgi:cyclic-di-GMP phosphodiesterase TipF (flagellum assembly factor)
MQNIIDQLAKQLRAPADAGTASAIAAGLSEPQAGTEQAITRSIEALKAASGAMRAAEGGGSGQPDPALNAVYGGDDTAGPQAGASTVADAVAKQSLEVCLDSILSLEDRKTRHFEMSVRMRLGAGEPVAIDDYALVTAGDGLRGRLDAAKLTRVARIAGPLSKRGLSAALFVSLAAESLADDTFLDACAGLITNQPDIVHQLVPSFSQGEIRSFAKPHWDTLATLKENGLRFGLERLGDLAMDFAILKERGFHFVKIDAGILLAGMQAHDGIVSALQVCQRVMDAGLDLIVGRIDDDATLAQVGGLGILYGQGAFFGVPRPVKIDFKAPHEAAA